MVGSSRRVPTTTAARILFVRSFETVFFLEVPTLGDSFEPFARLKPNVYIMALFEVVKHAAGLFILEHGRFVR